MTAFARIDFGRAHDRPYFRAAQDQAVTQTRSCGMVLTRPRQAEGAHSAVMISAPSRPECYSAFLSTDCRSATEEVYAQALWSRRMARTAP